MPDFFKYCPNCKSPDISNTEVKRFTCGDCGFQYYHNVASACAVIIYVEDKILFVVRKYDPAKGTLDLPGGFVDYGENVEQAIRREVKEEINLEMEGLAYLASFPNRYLYKSIEYHTLDFLFSARVASIDGLQVNDDVSGYVLLKENEIEVEKIGLTSIKNAVKHFLVNH